MRKTALRRTFSGTLLQQYYDDLSVGSLQSQLHAIAKLRASVEENEGHLCATQIWVATAGTVESKVNY